MNKKKNEINDKFSILSLSNGSSMSAITITNTNQIEDVLFYTCMHHSIKHVKFEVKNEM